MMSDSLLLAIILAVVILYKLIFPNSKYPG